jgi:hypothetical protein
MCRSGAWVFMSAFLLSGCAIHPLPEDITGNTTLAIVQKVRCEGFAALNDISIKLLRESNYQPLLSVAD